MQYYLISFIITIVIFIIIQYFEYTRISNENMNDDDYNYNEPYSLFTTNNCLLFMIIYIVCTIIAYYVYSANIDFSFLLANKNNNPNTSATTGGDDNNNDIDPKILSKINDNFSVGFEPFNSDNDSSDSCSE